MIDRVYSYELRRWFLAEIRTEQNRTYAAIDELWVRVWHGYIGSQLCWIVSD